ncbi:MAG: hypothetical protein ACD_34C00433G0002 [uncultured bacterium]|nr:MAG: hypothetical protein ACD_34C00433G0002 [uncultured bacterium]HCS38120.1 pyrimidine 5'-nucleotidase [Anaerolineaceae bacterium]
MRLETLFFDLDDTLYSSTSGIWEAIGARMIQYMVVKLGVPALKADEERERLFQLYGTTRRGLQAEYQIDEADFMDYVHDISIDQYLSPNITLRNILESYPQRKVIFTNADTGHAIRVLKTLGVQDLFDKIIDIRSIDPWCKPQTEAFAKALELAGINNPKNCVMIDDALRNLVTAHEFGLFTIHVGEPKAITPVDAAIMSIEELPNVLLQTY